MTILAKRARLTRVYITRLEAGRVAADPRNRRDGPDRQPHAANPVRLAIPDALESFTIALKPRSGEERYEVRLYMFEFAP